MSFYGEYFNDGPFVTLFMVFFASLGNEFDLKPRYEGDFNAVLKVHFGQGIYCINGILLISSYM